MLSCYLQLMLLPFLFIATIFQMPFESVLQSSNHCLFKHFLFCPMTKLLTIPDLKDELLQQKIFSHQNGCCLCKRLHYILELA